MKVLELARQAAAQKGWHISEADGEFKIHISGMPVVNIMLAQDGDQHDAAFLWASIGGLPEDGWALLRENERLSYSRLAVRGKELIAMHALYDQDAQLAEVGKSVFYVAQTAQKMQTATNTPPPAAHKPTPTAPASVTPKVKTTAKPETPASAPVETKGGGGWLWIVVVLIILAIIGSFLLS